MTTSHFKTVVNGLTDASQAQRGNRIYYHCEICEDFVPSQPTDNIKCKCGNIVIDAEYVRLFVKDFATFAVVEKTA